MCASGIAVLFGTLGEGSAGQGIATVPEFACELSLGIYLIVKGFKPSFVVPEPIRNLGVEFAPSDT